jgi:superfamily I DNA/RNA helicase
MAKKATDRRNKSRSQLTKADRAAIKQEQAAFIEKINSAELNEHQQAIVEAAKSGKGRYVVLAGPGSGKTFTSIKMSTCWSGKCIYFSYNKKIQLDTNDKLVAIDSKMIATTAHAFGLSCLIGYLRGAECRVDGDESDDEDKKYPAIVKAYMAQYWQPFVKSIRAELDEDEEADVEVMKLNAQAWTLTLIHYAMVSLTDPSPGNLATLVDDFDLEDITPASLTWDFVCAAVPAAIQEGIKQFLGPEHKVAFDDMIYLPNVLEGVPIRQYDHLIIDEAQDTSRASLELMLRACHAESQIFFVGDPRQSIYAFAGADFDSIPRIIKRLEASLLPLRIVFRCGETIVDVANQLCAEDEKLISAGLHTGKVEVIPAADYMQRLIPGRAAVIGRTTKRLVQGCLKVLQTGIKAKVLGKNLGANIAAVVTEIEAMRIRRGVPLLRPDLSNLLELLSEHKAMRTKTLKESRKNPEMAIAELEDKCETVRAFFTAYVGKCYDEGLRVPDDPPCAYNKTAKDFKTYIRGLFSDDDNSKDFVLFMTAHRSKGGEWPDVFIIGSDEFPHPRAKSERQQQQEQNLMYVAVTRAIENLCFVSAPFDCLKIPGYEPEEQQQGLTIISFPAADHFEVHPASEDGETVKPSIYDALGLEDYDPEVADTLFRDSLGIPRSATVELSNGETVIEGSVVVQPEPIEEPLIEGRVSRIAAIEVLCPKCNNACLNREGSALITYDLVGHSVTCSVCGKACIVPLNAFSLQGEVVAREKPTGVASKREKKGRTQKERKSKAGRKTKGKGVRQPLQLSLDLRVINTLNAMGVNKSELFEELLQQYEPFLDAWSELGNEDFEEEEEDAELDHDEIEVE